jgi:hypothetical protein
MSYKMSTAFKNGEWGTAGYNNLVQKEIQYIFNISYDVNPAMRLGIEYDYIYTKYANYGTPNAAGLFADRDGKLSAIRVGAWYFF